MEETRWICMFVTKETAACLPPAPFVTEHSASESTWKPRTANHFFCFLLLSCSLQLLCLPLQISILVKQDIDLDEVLLFRSAQLVLPRHLHSGSLFPSLDRQKPTACGHFGGLRAQLSLDLLANSVGASDVVHVINASLLHPA